MQGRPMEVAITRERNYLSWPFLVVVLPMPTQIMSSKLASSTIGPHGQHNLCSQ